MYTEYWVSASNVIMSQNETNVLTNEAKSSEGDNQISTVKKKKKNAVQVRYTAPRDRSRRL